jgi:hypothetical protein
VKVSFFYFLPREERQKQTRREEHIESKKYEIKKI